MKKEKKDVNIDLVEEVKRDFENRKSARKALELQWQLNIDFVRGNQNNYITKFDTVVPMGKQFYWQEREVFNHIAPMVEAKLGKLSAYKPTINVIPAGSESKYYESAKVCEKIITSVLAKNNMDALVERANMWSEMTGTAFYKVIWSNDDISKRTGAAMHGASGDVKVVVCSPFEIYPDSITAESIKDCGSIIHAKVYRVSEIERIWGIGVAGGDVDVFDISTTGKRSRRTFMENAAIVIERYERPSIAHPNGRLMIIAGEKLLYKGDLPYASGLPFIRQCAYLNAGCFYGNSAVERAIPVQKAYNSVKNRKSEFLNRLACGVLSVEDGSIDLQSLENDGLAPGKVLVYRQGMQAPKFVDSGTLPKELEREEERLLREFESISGTVNVVRDEGGNTSGIALQIMTEQENRMMARVVSEIMRAIAEVGTHILRLLKQFGGGRAERIVNGRSVEVFTWDKEQITSDEVTATSISKEEN